MIDKKISAFDIPRMRMTDLWDFDLKDLFKSLEGAKVYFSVFQNGRDELKVVHSGVNEEMYALLQTAFHRNIEMHDFLKLSLINIEKFREGEMNEAFEIMTRAVEYINIRNSKILNL